MMREKSDLSRREFLGSTAAAMAVAGGMNLRASDAADAAEVTPAVRSSPASILVLYLAKPVPSWPRPDFKPQDDIQRIRPVLETFETRPQLSVKFTGHELLRVPEDLSRVQGGLQEADGLLVFNLTAGTTGLSGQPFSPRADAWNSWPRAISAILRRLCACWRLGTTFARVR
jgi:hypothetical protein